MWSRWWCAGGGVGSLRQRLSAIVNISHGYGGRLHPLVPPFLGLKDIAVEFGGRRGGISSLSVGFNEFKTGISSSTLVSSPADSNGNSNASENGGNDKSSEMSYSETKKLMKLVNVESLKMKLCSEGKEFISYSELLQVCEKMGVTRTPDETSAFVNVLDEAGVILLFRDKVYLHPSKVADLVRKAVPLALTSEDDSMREEYKKLLAKKEEIDSLAHKQVRRILWCGLGLSLMQVGLFFRLTFWEFSWDVMEPIAFFVTSSGLIIGYAYFLFTSRDPTYQDFMKRLFNSRQKKLFKRYSFDVERFIELQKKFSTTLSVRSILKNHAGMELELEDALRKY